MSEGFMLRIVYKKQGRLAYLSHLETIRSVERIIRRAQLPYALTEGFNPHMKIAFGAALPTGAASEGEYVDVRLTDYVKPETLLEVMQQNAVANLYPIDCFYIGADAPAASMAFPISDWKVDIVGASKEQIDAAFAELCSQGFIEVARRHKAPKKVTFEGRLIDGPHVVQNAEDETEVEVSFSTKACDDGSLRPDKFCAAALERIEAKTYIKNILRCRLRSE